MKPEKKPNAALEKLTLADARKRIAEFKHLKPIEGKRGGAAVRPPKDAQGPAPKGRS
jgi:hypothetical protein